MNETEAMLRDWAKTNRRGPVQGKILRAADEIKKLEKALVDLVDAVEWRLKEIAGKSLHHIDGNRYNNAPDNLRFVELKENR